MSDQDFDRPRRLLLTLLEDADSRVVLSQTAILARAFEAEISGVLVEEETLFELAALTVCAEVGAVTRQFQQIDATTLAARARRSASLFRREMEALQETIGRPIPLQVLRGHALDPLRAAGRGDLVIYTGAHSRLDEREEVAKLLEAARHLYGVLLPPAGAPRQNGPLVAVYCSPETARRLSPVVEPLAGREGLDEHLASDTAEALVLGSLLAEQRRARLLVVELDEDDADEPRQRALRQSLRHLNCPLLLMNPNPA
ncbi:MAG TPA: hypothetical protein VK035_07915 [Kiloniellales bacterium]|nr:hypothetical protein [Kiloniellales bacterium]